VLDPVKVGGTTISFATLNSQGEIDRLQLRVGDMVVVEKGGEIIPKIVGRVREKGRRRSKPWQMPAQCPSCGHQLIREAEAAHFYCENPSCPARIRASILHFASRRAMDIEGLGESVVDRLVSAGVVGRVSDLYRLQADDLSQLWRMGEVSAGKLIDQIQRSKNAGLARLLYALGIRHVGQRAAKRLAQAFGSLRRIQQASEADLLDARDIGKVVAKSVARFLSDPDNQRLLDELEQHNLRLTEDRGREAGGPLEGRTVVISGAVVGVSRDEMNALVERLGGRASGAVTSKTHLLVLGEAPGQSKVEKAIRLGIPTLSAQEFLKQYSQT
jgi:DNA ligase (NAD+)